MTDMRQSRRQFLKSVAAAAAFPTPAIAQGAALHVVVAGGGFAGTTCARGLKKANAKLAVTLVEANATYTAPPMSNAVIAGLRDLRLQQFGYDGLRMAGIDVAISAVTAADPQARAVTLANGTKLTYHRLVVAPGIDFRWDAVHGFNETASATIPHAFKGGEQVDLLRRQLEAMPDGGTVVISAPVNPARCPPAPYERASLIAYYLKTKKPRSKVIVLDAKDGFTMQRLFQDAWKELYPGMIEWISIADGGALTSVDVATKTLTTDFDKYKAAVANIIPPQKAGRLAGAMPRSASAANSQAKICAAAIAKLLAGKTPDTPTLTSSCFSLIAPDYAISQRGAYRPVNGQYNEADGGPVVSPLSASPDVRRDEARQASAWFYTITGEVFG
jgi:sulfide dehydrogenase [flavocytochrome c] flavoprotein subunit